MGCEGGCFWFLDADTAVCVCVCVVSTLRARVCVCVVSTLQREGSREGGPVRLAHLLFCTVRSRLKVPSVIRSPGPTGSQMSTALQQAANVTGGRGAGSGESMGQRTDIKVHQPPRPQASRSQKPGECWCSTRRSSTREVALEIRIHKGDGGLPAGRVDPRK